MLEPRISPTDDVELTSILGNVRAMSRAGNPVNQDRFFAELWRGGLLLAVFDGHGSDGHNVAAFLINQIRAPDLPFNGTSLDGVVNSLQLALYREFRRTGLAALSGASGAIAHLGVVAEGAAWQLTGAIVRDAFLCHGELGAREAPFSSSGKRSFGNFERLCEEFECSVDELEARIVVGPSLIVDRPKALLGLKSRLILASDGIAPAAARRGIIEGLGIEKISELSAGGDDKTIICWEPPVNVQQTLQEAVAPPRSPRSVVASATSRDATTKLSTSSRVQGE